MDDTGLPWQQSFQRLWAIMRVLISTIESLLLVRKYLNELEIPLCVNCCDSLLYTKLYSVQCTQHCRLYSVNPLNIF